MKRSLCGIVLLCQPLRDKNGDDAINDYFSDNSGWVCCYSNKVLDGMYWIGCTSSDPIDEMQLIGQFYPCEFEMEFAKKVDDISKNETMIRNLLEKYYVAKNFVKMDLSEIKLIFEQINEVCNTVDQVKNDTTKMDNDNSCDYAKQMNKIINENVNEYMDENVEVDENKDDDEKENEDNEYAEDEKDEKDNKKSIDRKHLDDLFKKYISKGGDLFNIKGKSKLSGEEKQYLLMKLDKLGSSKKHNILWYNYNYEELKHMYKTLTKHRGLTTKDGFARELLKCNKLSYLMDVV